MIVRDRPTGFQLFFILKGSVLPRVRRVLAANILVAVAVTLLHGAFFSVKITLTPIPFSLIGLALAIFLGFRNATAYDRWWEGRRLWGGLVHDCRNLARQCLSLVDGPAPEAARPLADIRTRMIFRAIAYAHALRQLLRDAPDAAQLRPYLTEEEWRACGEPRAALQRLMLGMGGDLRRLQADGLLDGPRAAAIDHTLSSMVQAATGCERLRTTPIPFSYTLLLHRTAYLYCFLLPFGLVDSIGFMTPVVVAIVAYTFFGLDALGDEIEEPFGISDNDLPLDAICRTIEIDLRTAAGDTSPPAVLQPNGFVLT
ncbi:bestrophin family protein [Noviherbaspirillum aridicola]|uniref:Membrane protein n=1 Tax=Noviherbaspirillum aridicola TaxID=2849687 RepID=A0ABQ4PZQ2_9BURK|nr:bestrophin family ion channel [Noviherbaspirillum aridicola]GIZ50241.1 membrane protein [Noviherbaspirillum aridicola]